MQSTPMKVSTIGSINQRSQEEKRQIYARLIPQALLDRFNFRGDFLDENGEELLHLACPPGSSTVEMKLFHQANFPDPILYGHMTGTFNGLVHILLYILNDPTSPRFDVDCMPDGTPTRFGTSGRNLDAEIAAMRFGLAPGQIRRGLRMLGPAIEAFEVFVSSLGHDMFFAEPLYYHTAVLFEHYGFTYQKGRRLMERIQAGFLPQGELISRIDGSNPFRQPEASSSIRMRSWAIHDGLLGEPFTDVTMYKRVGKHAGVSTCHDCDW